jgi:hypothetical protein
VDVDQATVGKATIPESCADGALKRKSEKRFLKQTINESLLKQ